jgi:hypothetical protein
VYWRRGGDERGIITSENGLVLVLRAVERAGPVDDRHAEVKQGLRLGEFVERPQGQDDPGLAEAA